MTYGYDHAGRPVSVASGGTTFVSIASADGYAPHGAIQSATYGANIAVGNSFNTRLQPISRSAQSGVNTIMRFNYDFGLEVANNGNVKRIDNGRVPARSQVFSYDALNRLRAAYTTGPEWGVGYIYDGWGNLTNMEDVGKDNTWPLNAPANEKNQLTIDSHDAAGNLWNNNQYIWDAENRLYQSAGVTYSYDGDGKRVKKSSGTVYWTGTSSDALVETDLSGASIKAEYIYFGGKRVARIAGSVVNYYFADHLGTSRVMTLADGTICYDADFYPYGAEQHVYTNTCPQPYKFTGKERDTETGLDYFGARYNASNMGRFLSPDPEQESGFLYMDDPQAWNGYAYARNNPLLYSDPDGMSYRVCDSDGKNCYNFENDADYNKWLKDNNQVERGGGIYQKNPDGSQTKLGTVEYYDKDVYAMLANVDRMAGTPVRALAWTTMGFVGGMMIVEAAPLAANAMRSVLQQATGQAQNTTLKEIVKRLYQTQDKIPGGTAGAVRDHLATGQWLSNSGHFVKLAERLTQLNRLIQSGTLSSSDLAIATAIAADLKNALGR